VIPRFWLITPDDGRDLAPAIRTFGRLGVRGIVLRESGPVSGLVDVARDAGFTHVFAHARAPDAAASGADGVHIPDGADRPPGPWAASTHDPVAARGALDAGAAYALLSPVWKPTSKPEDARPAIGISALLAAGPGPVLALGGVDPARYRAVREAGGYGAAVLGAWWRDPPSLAAFFD